MFPKRLFAIDIFGQIIKNTQLSYLTVNQQQHSSSEQLAHPSGDILPAVVMGTTTFSTFQQVERGKKL